MQSMANGFSHGGSDFHGENVMKKSILLLTAVMLSLSISSCIVSGKSTTKDVTVRDAIYMEIDGIPGWWTDEITYKALLKEALHD